MAALFKGLFVWRIRAGTQQTDNESHAGAGLEYF